MKQNRPVHILAPAVAITSLALSAIVRSAYEFDTWQCLVSLMLVDFLFVVFVSTSKINPVKAHWINLVFYCSIIANGVFAVIVFMRFNGLIGKISPGFDVMESIYFYSGVVLTIMLFLAACTRQWILGRFDDLCWPRVFDDVCIFDSYDSWQNNREIKK